MLLDVMTKASTDRSVVIRIMDSTTGLPETAVEHNTTGIDLWYRREGAAKTSITEAALAALTTAHTDGGIEHIADGYYRLDLPDAAFATGAQYVDVGGAVTGMVVYGGRVRLVDVDLEDSVRGGMTALPNAAADASGGLPISDSGGLDMDALRTGLDDIKGTGFVKDTHSLVDIEAYVDDIGAAGAGLTAIPWNASWDAEVQSEVTDALNAYDPPTKAELDSGFSALNDPTAATIADAVWDEATSGHAVSGSTGEALTNAASGDPWSTSIPGAYGAGTAGNILGSLNDLSSADVNAACDTALSDYDPPTKAEMDSGFSALNDPTSAAIADAVWDEATSGHVSAGTTGKALVDTLADTNEMQADLADAGRIDALIDSIIATQASGVALTSSERDSVATAILDLANGVETGHTVRQALRLSSSALGGKASGLDSNAPVYRDVNDAADRITATTDADGNRSEVTLNL